MTLGNSFILVIDGENNEGAINTAHMTHIKVGVHQMSNTPMVSAKLLGVENRAILHIGDDAQGYFDWLSEIVDIYDYRERDNA
jgi:hypothetical protein